jgi:hypothetical protein
MPQANRTEAFIEELTSISSLIFVRPPLLLQNLPCLSFSLRITTAFIEEFILFLFYICFITAAFTEEFTSVSSFLTICCNSLKTRSLFHSKLQAFYVSTLLGFLPVLLIIAAATILLVWASTPVSSSWDHP